MPVFVVSMECSYTHSLRYCLWPISEEWPTKPKYLLDLYRESLPTPALYHQPSSNIIQCLANSQSVAQITHIITILTSFYLPINLLLISMLDFVIPALISLGLSSAPCQQCTPQCPLDLNSTHHSTDFDTRYAIHGQFFNLLSGLLMLN